MMWTQSSVFRGGSWRHNNTASFIVVMAPLSSDRITQSNFGPWAESGRGKEAMTERLTHELLIHSPETYGWCHRAKNPNEETPFAEEDWELQPRFIICNKTATMCSLKSKQSQPKQKCDCDLTQGTLMMSCLHLFSLLRTQGLQLDRLQTCFESFKSSSSSSLCVVCSQLQRTLPIHKVSSFWISPLICMSQVQFQLLPRGPVGPLSWPSQW